MLKTFVAGITLALLMLGPAGAGTRHCPCASGDPSEVHPALFTVHGPKGVAYLFGSVHELPPGIAWQRPGIMAAMKRADTFVFEIPLDHVDQDRAEADRVQKKVMDLHGLLPPGQSLRGQLSKDRVPRYDALIEALNVSPGYIDRLQPWLAAMVLQTVAFYHSDARSMNGVDMSVYNLACAMHKQTRGLETLEDQLAVIGPVEQKLGTEELDRLIDASAGPAKYADPLLAAWKRGDVDGITRQVAAELDQNPDLKQALLDTRNAHWVEELKAMLETPHVYFVTVGAAHLGGPAGLPALFRQAGYRVDGPH